MGGKTSSASKNKWNEKAYDRINLTVPKGEKGVIREHADKHGESLNAFVNRAIKETIVSDNKKEVK